MNDRSRPDIVINDRDSNAIAIVEVNSMSIADLSSALAQLRRHVAALGDDNTFAILADPVTIRVYRGEPTHDSRPIILSTPDILHNYDADYDKQIVYESYFASLIEAWLNDVSIHWQSEHPPGETDLPLELITRLRAA